MPFTKYTELLEGLYKEYAQRRYVRGDPLEVLYRYEDPCDREVAGLIAALLAYGRAGQIVKSATWVLDRLEPGPVRSLLDLHPSKLAKMFAGFRHRFQREVELTGLLLGVRRAIRKYGSLCECFRAFSSSRDDTVLPGLRGFVGELNAGTNGKCGHLLPDPNKGSACKRYHLYLRWMVRRDEVDPGGWDSIPASRLIVPLDTHMHRIARALGTTRRKSADLQAAIETTEAFRCVCPDDPVRYDFALTRLGIRSDADMTRFLTRCERMSM